MVQKESRRGKRTRKVMQRNEEVLTFDAVFTSLVTLMDRWCFIVVSS